MRRHLALLLVPLACLVAAGDAAAAAAPEASVAETLTGRLVRVVDGDTVKVRLRGGRERSVRLIGIDTPELWAPGGAECGARAAKRKLRRLVRGRRSVRLRTDPTQARQDRYGRLLAYVHRGGDGADLGRRLVRSGWARVYVYGGRPFRRHARYERAARRAEGERRGLHARCA